MGAHVRAPEQRHAALLGQKARRAARRRHDADQHDAGAVSGISAAAGLTAGWWHHSCALLTNGDGAVLGRERVGAVRQRHDDRVRRPGRDERGGTGITWTSSATSVATIDGDRTGDRRRPGHDDDHGDRRVRARRAQTTLTVVQPSFTLTVIQGGARRAAWAP